MLEIIEQYPQVRKLLMVFVFLPVLLMLFYFVSTGDKTGRNLSYATSTTRIARPPTGIVYVRLVPESDPAQLTVESCCNVKIASFHMEPGTDYTLKLTPDQYTLHGVSDVILMPKPDCYDDRSSITKRFNVLADGNEIINLYIGYAPITDCMLAP